MKRSVWPRLTLAWWKHLVALALLVAVTSFLVSLSLGAGAIGSAHTIRDALEPVEGQASYTIQTRVAPDPEAQDAVVRDVIDLELSVPYTIERAEVESPGDTPFAEWSVTVTAVSSDDVSGLVDAGERIRLALRDTTAVVRGVQVEDILTEQLAPIAETIPSLQTLTRVPALVLLVLAVVVVIQAAATLPRARERALRILDARGASRLRIALHAGNEAVITGALGAGAGLVIARLVLQQWGGGPLAIQLLAAVTLTLGYALASARFAFAMSHRAGRATRVDLAAIMGVVVVVAGVTLWRLLRSGLDAISAPALGLAVLAGALLSLVIVIPIGVGLAGLSSRVRGIVTPLAFRLAARRHAASAPAALLVAMAVASLALAATFDGTERESRQRDLALDRGSDLRVALPSPIAGRQGTPIAPFAEIDGVAGAVGVRVTQGSIASEPATVVTMPVGAAEGIVTTEVPDSLEPDLSGMAIGPGPHTVDVSVRLLSIEWIEPRVDVPAHAIASARTIDDDGVVTTSESAPFVIDLDAEASLVQIPLDLPAGTQRILGVSVYWELQHASFLDEAPAMADDDFFALSVEEFDEKYDRLMSDGLPGFNSSFELEVLSIEWAGQEIPWPVLGADDALDSDERLPFVTSGMFGMDWGAPERIGAIDLAAPTNAATVEAIASPEVVELLALEIGDTFGVTLDGPTWNFELVGISSEIPASSGGLAVMASQTRLAEFLFANGRDSYGPSEVWLALEDGAPPEDVLEAVTEIEPEAGVVHTQLDRTLAAGTTVWAFWAVAAAAVGLAWVGLAALRLSESGQMGQESQILRSLGVPARQVRAAHRGEFYARAVPAAIGGLLVGLALGRYVLPGMVTLASGSVREAVFGVALVPFAAGLAALVVALMLAARIGSRT